MSKTFEKLPEEKQQQILKICIEEFAKSGFEKTTTDMIVQRAGISKGLIFHYFGSKKNLFLYVVKYVYAFLAEVTEKEFENKSSAEDFFERVRDLFIIKSRLASEYYYENQFMLNVFLNPPLATKKEIEELFEKHREIYGESYQLEHVYKVDLIDTSKLRENISPQRVINMTMFIVDQLTNKYMLWLTKNDNSELNMEAIHYIIREMDDYLEIVKNGVYN